MPASAPEKSIDVAVVGGGPAGLSAALVLGRCCRRVTVFDTGSPRNSVSPELHGFLSRDCSSPADLRRLGRDQLRRYETVEVRDVAVVNAYVTPDGFGVDLATGEKLKCRKLLLATGVKDELPQVDGFGQIYGNSAFHCPYCDGWEWRGKRIAVLGDGETGHALALEMLGWSRDLIVFTNAADPFPAELCRELERQGIRIEPRRIAVLESEAGLLRHVRLHDGTVVDRDVIFFAAPAAQGSDLASGLGCEFNDRGSVKTRAYEKTNVPGLYVAGDASHHVELAIVAAAEGAMAAFAINSELLQEDRL